MPMRGLHLGDPTRPPRILLLHGFTGASADWAGWPFATPALAPDLPGHGAAPDPPGDDDFRTGVARLLAALPPSIEALIGYSLGGRIALGLLAAAPGRFRALALISAHPGLPDAAARAARRAADQHWIDLLRHQGIGPFVDAWEAQPLFATERLAPPAARAARRARRLAQRPAGLAGSLATFGLGQMPDLHDALLDHPGPLTWITGALDNKFSTLAAGIAARRRATRHHCLPGVGHNPLFEAPARLWPLLGV